MSSSKFFNGITAVVMIFALVFTAVFLYFGSQENVVEAMSSASEMPYEETFDQFSVIDISITISQEDWTDMMGNPLSEEYKQCDVTINGVTYSDVAIRTKGNTSLNQVASRDSNRYSFKIEFDHYDNNKSMNGLDKLVLNNLFSDATYVKEYISYDIFHYLDVETPYYAFANITVNGENFGCYLALEAMEDSFLTRAYDSKGQLYKPESTQASGGGRVEDGGGMPDGERFGGERADRMEAPQGAEAPEEMKIPEQMEQRTKQRHGGKGMSGFGLDGGSDLVYVDDEIGSYSDIFDNAVFDPSDEDKQRVITALEKLSAGEELETYVDVDACLRYFAAQTFVVNLDSYYSNLKHNYYLYENEGQITMLPWDLNLAFGGFQSGDATSAVNSAIDTPMGGNLEQERPLFSKLMEVEGYKERYHSYLNDIVEGYVNSGQFTQTLSKIKGVIEPYVDKDTTAFYSYSEFKEAIATLKTFVLLRSESVEKQLCGEIASVSSERNTDTVLVDASDITLGTMGMQQQVPQEQKGPEQNARE